jgi:CheY-like chemotaxis protein
LHPGENQRRAEDFPERNLPAAQRKNFQQIGIRQITYADFEMPGLDGIGLLQTIRSCPPTRNTPFIMVTGRTDRAILERAKTFGLNNYITKPFTVATMKRFFQTRPRAAGRQALANGGRLVGVLAGVRFSGARSTVLSASFCDASTDASSTRHRRE